MRRLLILLLISAAGALLGCQQKEDTDPVSVSHPQKPPVASQTHAVHNGSATPATTRPAPRLTVEQHSPSMENPSANVKSGSAPATGKK